MDAGGMELVAGLAIGSATVLLLSPAAISASSLATIGLLFILAKPKAWPAMKSTVQFFTAVSKSKKGNNVDGQSELLDKGYANLKNSFYDLATDFYEWGWGTSFHFADFRASETFKQSLRRHEYYLAGRLGVSSGATILDCGCGVAGPSRSIAKFLGVNVKAVTINQYEVNRGNALCAHEGLEDQVELVQADFMKMPFADASFDGVYAIESTCHAPDRAQVYSEIFRVLKPGATFACYEWCRTDKYDAKNEHHRRIKRDIEIGGGLPDLVHTSVCTQALGDAGFEVLEARDCMQDGHLGRDGEPWYTPMVPSWNPSSWPRFQFNAVMFRVMPLVLKSLELVKVLPEGTAKTQTMLQACGRGCAQGGQTGTFTPAWLMVGRKPL